MSTNTSSPQGPRALLIDDDSDFAEGLATLVSREGFQVRTVGTLEAAAAALEEAPAEVLLVDRSLPDGDGLELALDPERRGDAEVIVITGNADVDSAIEALRQGALDYLTKPVDRGRLKATLANVARTRGLKHQLTSLRTELRGMGRFGHLVGQSTAMQRVFDRLDKVARTSASVLLIGESGTGKEVAARTLHDLSERASNPMEAVNCGAITATLIESELFGHEKGSFTGADKRRPGFFERAHGGTLFLDEITEMPMDLQVKLLRVLETGQVQRVGGSKPIDVDVRVVAATNRDPMQAVQDGKLREDLYYRLAVFPIQLPPLREREGDVQLLASHFLELLNAQAEESKRWAEGALESLARMSWDGNVRQLRNVVQRSFILSQEELVPDLGDAPGEGAMREAGALPQAAAGPAGDSIVVPLGSSIAEAEQALILATLEAKDGNKQDAVEVLGISLKTLYNRLRVYEAMGSQS